MSTVEELSVHGLAVRETDRGDNDKLITLVTREAGKITVTGKGVKSLKSKNMVSCQLFSYSSFLLRRSGKYFYVAESELIESFYNIRVDLDKLALASYICDVTAELSVEGMEDPELLSLALNTLYALSETDESPVKLKAAFEIRVSAVGGFQPDLSVCGACGCELSGEMYLDIMNGRVLCKKCKPSEEQNEALSDSGTARLYMLLTEPVLRAIGYIVTCPPKRFLSFTLDADELYLLSRAAETYLVNHMEHSFYTLDFYKSLIN